MADITVVWRKEAAVRAAGVKAGEFDLGTLLTPELCQGLKCARFTPNETPMIRLNTLNASLKDKRVRQAMSYAVDRKLLVDTIYGGFAAQASQPVAPHVVGYNPDLKPYPYDLDKAKQLVKDAGAEGAKLDLVWLPGKIGRDAELSEYLIDAWGKIGLKVNSVSKDVAAWTTTSRAVAPESRSDMIVLSHGNGLGDSGQTVGQYIICAGSQSHFCDPKADQLYKGNYSGRGMES